MAYISSPTTIEALVETLEEEVTTLRKTSSGWDFRLSALEILYNAEKALGENQPELAPPSRPFQYLFLLMKYKDEPIMSDLEYHGMGKGYDVRMRVRLCAAYEFLLRASLQQRS